MRDNPHPPRPLLPMSEVRTAFDAALPEITKQVHFLLSARAVPLTRKQQALIGRKLDQVLTKSGPYVLGLLAISGNVAPERVGYALIEGLLREVLQSLGCRVRDMDACAYLLQRLQREFTPKQRYLKIPCYRTARDAVAHYAERLFPAQLERVQDVLTAWAQTSDARKHLTYARLIATAARRFRKGPPQRATQRLLLDLQHEYNSSSSLFELRLRLLLALRSKKDWAY